MSHLFKWLHPRVWIKRCERKDINYMKNIFLCKENSQQESRFYFCCCYCLCILSLWENWQGSQNLIRSLTWGNDPSLAGVIAKSSTPLSISFLQGKETLQPAENITSPRWIVVTKVYHWKHIEFNSTHKKTNDIKWKKLECFTSRQ